MTASRRSILAGIGASAAALPWSAQHSALLAQQAAPDAFGKASDAEREIRIVNIEALEEDARRVLSPGRMAIMGPSGDGWTYRENRRAFGDFPIQAGRLRGVSDDAIDLRTKLLGADLTLPVFTAPTGSQGNFHVNAEIPNVIGTAAAGSLFVQSGASNRSIEQIGEASKGPKWFQIYMNRDMEINRWLVQRAKAAGFTAVVLTADALGPGQSDDYIRLGRPTDPALSPGNHNPSLGGKGNFRDFKRDISFKDIAFLREASGLPVIVKGVMVTEDVKASLAEGAAGIWVSNHGGRQMDGVPGSISVLRACVDATEGKVPVMLDSGIRRGIDVFKALALGATAVGIGRPALWGLATGGSLGVKAVYAQLASELRGAMLLSGVAKVSDIKRHHVGAVRGA